MSLYYYTLASLPFLLFNQKPSITVEEFLEACKELVSEDDYALLIQAGPDFPGGSVSGCQVLDRWKCWEAGMKNELVRIRARKKNTEPVDVMPDVEEDIAAFAPARNAADDDSPLRGEEILDKAAWLFLEEIETGHYFDISMLIIYYIKLRILERKFSLDKEKGKEMYKKIMDNFNNSINAWESSYGK